jgi:hypothetical protein
MLDQRLGRRVGQFDPFEIEENQMLVDGGALLAGAGDQGAVFGVVGLGGVQQVRVDGGLVHLLGQGFEFVERGLEHRCRAGVGVLDLAAIVGLELLGACQGTVKIAAEGRIVHALIEVAQVPGDAVGAAGGFGGIHVILFDVLPSGPRATLRAWGMGFSRLHPARSKTRMRA